MLNLEAKYPEFSFLLLVAMKRVRMYWTALQYLKLFVEKLVLLALKLVCPVYSETACQDKADNACLKGLSLRQDFDPTSNGAV